MEIASPDSSHSEDEPTGAAELPQPNSASGSGVRPAQPSRIGARYDVHELLGRGGMAAVYRVTDVSTGRQLAVKQLTLQPGTNDQRETVALFEREFHTLAQLSHPHVIAVYDYGFDDHGPYYTMELLDGGDIKERCPVPWREACALLFEACSSLALLHSRRLVHRDVSPRNIRCTKQGHAKLIDFGAMGPMGRSSQIVGTPAFIAPEVVHHLMLDARTDLFSLGATLYYTLTGRPPYPGRDFAQVIEAWHRKPVPPSSVVPEIPIALDALVMSLVSIDPALRPRTAFEVMQRLEAIAGLEPAEPLSVSQAYLSTPTLVGRDEPLALVGARIKRTLRGHGGALLIEGMTGVGRSRMLDACVLEAKTLGATVLRASADAAEGGALAVAQRLVDQLHEMLPDLSRASAKADATLWSLFETSEPLVLSGRDSKAPGPTRPALQVSLSQLMLKVAAQRPLVIAVDDVHRIDDASTALLAAVAGGARGKPLLIVATTERIALETPGAALELLASASTKLALEPLTLELCEALLGSVFGDVPNIQLLSARIHTVALGNPRECMDLVQHLVDHGRIVYDRGSWTLPSELAASDLPDSAEEAFRQRLSALSPLARFLVEAHALASHDAFTLEDYAALTQTPEPQRLDRALAELVSQQVLASEGRFYSFAHRASARTLVVSLDPSESEQRHRALARLYEQKSAFPLIAVKHLIAGGLHERGLDQLLPSLGSFDDPESLRDAAQLSLGEITALLARALELAQRLRRAPRELAEIRHALVMLSGATDDAFYWLAAPLWLEQLERDSGLGFWRELSDIPDKGERLTRAFVRATEQYAATPEAERVYRPDEAIKFLVRYVALSLATGAKIYDTRLLRSLPALLEPFAPVSPLVDAVWQNAIASYDAVCVCRIQQARNRWIDVFTRLPTVSVGELQYVNLIRNALAYAIGTLEARLGLESTTKWVDFLDQDPLQAVNAMYLRRIVRLQYGDLEGAERFRKQAELLAVQASSPQWFANHLSVELVTHAMANNLTGVKQVKDRIAPLALRYAGWAASGHLAEAYFQRLRGNLEAACEAFERCLALCSPDPTDESRAILAWPAATAAYLETLIELDRAAEARVCGERALATCAELGIDIAAHGIVRSLALALAKLGHHQLAIERLQTVIDEQLALGVAGLQLGASYEARTRIAIWAADDRAIAQFAQLTAREYRHGVGSALAARYDRLMDDAHRAGVEMLPTLSDFQSTALLSGTRRRHVSAQALVAREMRGAETPEERAACALRLLCETQGASGGYLYLRGKLGVSRAASRGASPLPDGLDEFISEYFTRETLSEEIATSLLTETDVSCGDSGCDWTDSNGVVVHPVLITCVVHGVALHAGVAALIADGLQGIAGGTQLAAAIGAHLVQAGDVGDISGA